MVWWCRHLLKPRTGSCTSTATVQPQRLRSVGWSRSQKYRHCFAVGRWNRPYCQRMVFRMIFGVRAIWNLLRVDVEDSDDADFITKEIGMEDQFISWVGVHQNAFPKCRPFFCVVQILMFQFNEQVGFHGNLLDIQLRCEDQPQVSHSQQPL